MPVLLTVDEVTDRLRVSRRTVERLIAAGRIRVIRVGRRILISERELEAYIGSLRGRPAA